MRRPTADSPWAEARNLLCVRLDTIGDVMMTAPAIAALKRAKSGRRITLLTSRLGAQAARLIPEIDDVIVYEAPWVRATAGASSSDDDRRMISRLSAAGFDGAVTFTVYSQNPLPAAMLSYLADIPLRLAHCRENPYHLLTDWVPDPEPGTMVRHEVDRQLDLVASIGCDPLDSRLMLRIPDESRRRVDRLLEESGINRGRPWTVLHAGASAESRRYPPDGFAKSVDALVFEHGWQVALTGSRAEMPLIESVLGAMRAPAVSLAGRLSLTELAALLELAPILISNNTAPVHIASALGTPVVALHALTNPQHRPWRVPSRVLYQDVPCRFCYKSVCPEGHNHCLSLVPPESIVSAALELAAEAGTALSPTLAAPQATVNPPLPQPAPVGAEARSR
jgi:lipopolysaccharide heptosyltransferase II